MHSETNVVWFCVQFHSIGSNTGNQSIILFSDAGYISGSHEADVDLQLTNKKWNNKENNL